MNTDPSTNACPKCGTVIPADAPQGLCPRCVLAGVAAPTEVSRTTGPRVAAPPIDAVRAAFPQLEILELIGQGGMGVVFKARQPKLDRLVALKILSESLAADPTFEERFTREARMLAKLSHPNIVAIYDHGVASAPQPPSPTSNLRSPIPHLHCFYLLMEFVDGVNLRQAMAAGRFTAPEALALVPRICEALQYAHEEGVLHRDIKPENILLDGRGRVKIADFGIAKMLGEAQPGGTLTASGAALGTPHYMSPEQIEHPSEVDHRTDIYSLGVVFYEMLTGELPLGRFGPPSAKSAVDRRVDEIVFRTLEKERELRQQSAGEVKTQVETVAAGMKSGSTPPRGAGAPRILKGQGCILLRPETMATFDGQLFAYQNRGQLLLDEERLTFTKDGFPMVIPLSAITDLSIGKYPRSMNPAGINLISLNYTDGTTDKRVHLSPMDGWLGFPAQRNRDVADWHSAIREAVVAATGKPPGETPADQLGIPGGKGIGLLLMLMPAIVIAVSLGVIISLSIKGGGFAGAPELLLVFLAVLIPLLFIYNHRRRGPHLDRGVTPTKNGFGWIRALLLILFLFGSVFVTAFAVYQLSARRSPAVAPQAAPVAIEPALPQRTAVAAAQANPTDPIRDIELKVAKQQLERTLNELADSRLELATSESMLALSERHPAKNALLERLRYLEERSAVLRKELQAGSANQEAGEDVVRQVELSVTRDQYEKTLTALVEAKKELATSPAMTGYGDNHPAKKALLTKIQFLEERQAVLKKELEQIHSRAKPVAPVPAAIGLPMVLPPGKPGAAAQKWHFAWVALTEKRKQLEVGRIAPEAVLAAERDLAVAEGEFHGKPETGAEANFAYTRAMLAIVRRKQAAGLATQREVNDATLALTQAGETLKKLQANQPTPTR